MSNTITSRKYIPRSERIFFSEHDRSYWMPKLKELSELGLPIKSIADHFGCGYQTLAQNEEAMEIVQRGWAADRAAIEFELRELAYAAVTPDMDPVEKAGLRTAKNKALQILHKVLHADPWVPPQEQERIKRLSDEELQAELAKHIKTTNIKAAKTL